MNSLLAYERGKANRGEKLMVFDWEKAARLIKDSKCTTASAGLSEDWEWTGGSIFKNGKPVNKEDTYTYLASTWAIPELDINGKVISCFRMESETEEALKIINE